MRPTCRAAQRSFCQEGRSIRDSTRPLTILIAISAILVGCGPAAQTPTEAERDPNSSEGVRRTAERLAEASTRRVINSGPAEISVTRENGDTAWILKSESTRIGIEDEGGSQGYLNEVTGTLFGEDGKPLSTLKSTQAKADNAKRVFKLIDNAEITSLEYNAVLKANEVEWLEDRQLYAAKGNVTITTDTWKFGPTDILYARPDLTMVGSPDKF